MNADILNELVYIYLLLAYYVPRPLNQLLCLLYILLSLVENFHIYNELDAIHNNPVYILNQYSYLLHVLEFLHLYNAHKIVDLYFCQNLYILIICESPFYL